MDLASQALQRALSGLGDQATWKLGTDVPTVPANDSSESVPKNVGTDGRFPNGFRHIVVGATQRPPNFARSAERIQARSEG